MIEWVKNVYIFFSSFHSLAKHLQQWVISQIVFAFYYNIIGKNSGQQMAFDLGNTNLISFWLNWDLATICFLYFNRQLLATLVGHINLIRPCNTNKLKSELKKKCHKFQSDREMVPDRKAIMYVYYGWLNVESGKGKWPPSPNHKLQWIIINNCLSKFMWIFELELHSPNESTKFLIAFENHQQCWMLNEIWHREIHFTIPKMKCSILQISITMAYGK